MDYSAAERERAEKQIPYAINIDGKPYRTMLDTAIELRCELNRAVDLLREAEGYTQHCGSDECGKNWLYNRVRDFLSHYPEGESR